jgi:hypothetical protein
MYHSSGKLTYYIIANPYLVNLASCIPIPRIFTYRSRYIQGPRSISDLTSKNVAYKIRLWIKLITTRWSLKKKTISRFRQLVWIIHKYLCVVCGSKEKILDEFKFVGRHEKCSVATATSEATEENRGKRCWQDSSEDPSNTDCHLDSSPTNKRRKSLADSLMCNVAWRFCKPAKSFDKSICMELINSLWTDLQEIWNFRFFLRHVEKNQVSLKFGRNNGYLARRLMCI